MDYIAEPLNKKKHWLMNPFSLRKLPSLNKLNGIKCEWLTTLDS